MIRTNPASPARHSRDLLIGQSVEPNMKKAIFTFLDERPEITRVLNLITMQLGDDVTIAVKAELSRDQSTKGVVDSINQVESELKRAFPDVKW